MQETKPPNRPSGDTIHKVVVNQDLRESPESADRVIGHFNKALKQAGAGARVRSMAAAMLRTYADQLAAESCDDLELAATEDNIALCAQLVESLGPDEFGMAGEPDDWWLDIDDGKFYVPGGSSALARFVADQLVSE